MASSETAATTKTTERPMYIIVQTHDAEPATLERMVNQKIREGYTPVGGVHSEADYSAFFQAMISTNVKSAGRRKTRRRKTIA